MCAPGPHHCHHGRTGRLVARMAFQSPPLLSTPPSERTPRLQSHHAHLPFHYQRLLHVSSPGGQSGGRASRRTRFCAHPWGCSTSYIGPHAPSCSPCAALTNRASSGQNPPKIVNFEPEIVQKRPAVTAVTAVARGEGATLAETGKVFLQNDRFFSRFCPKKFYCCNALYSSSSSRW